MFAQEAVNTGSMNVAAIRTDILFISSLLCRRGAFAKTPQRDYGLWVDAFFDSIRLSVKDYFLTFFALGGMFSSDQFRMTSAISRLFVPSIIMCVVPLKTGPVHPA